jgi:integrase/recombinase XerD
MDSILIRFDDHLKETKNMANNSRIAYRRDIVAFETYLKSKEIQDLTEATNTEIVGYLLQLKNEGKSSATVNRKLASLRAFYRFLSSGSQLIKDPTVHLKSPRIEQKHTEFLTIQEIERLLEVPAQTVKGIRDKALLELLYATGMRVSEVAGANISDVNLRIGFVMTGGEHGKARLIPLGRPARAAVETYVYEGRSKLLREKATSNEALFLNYNGERLTRQGIWKLIKEYAAEAGLIDRLTPQTLRNSFAVHMLQNGADLRSVQELLGHEDIAATKLYLSVAKNRIKDVYDKTHPRA